MSELEGKIIAITGAARGMGRAFTRSFLERGAKVVAMDISWEPTGFSGDSDKEFLSELESRPDDVIVATVAILKALALLAKTIGMRRTSGGTGKTELSRKQTTARPVSAHFLLAKSRTL